MLHNFKTFLRGSWFSRRKHIVSVDLTTAEDIRDDVLRVLSWFRLINNTATAAIITDIVAFPLFECFWKTSRL